MSLRSSSGYPFTYPALRITRQYHELNAANPLWALPAVALIVVASAGAVVAQALFPVDEWRAGLTLMVSAFLLVVGLVIGAFFYTIYMLRLILHGLPQGVNVLSGWITLGIAGQGGYAVLVIGQGFKTWLPVQYGLSSFMRGATTATTLDAICVFTGFVLWAVTTMWFFYNMLAMFDVLKNGGFPFSLPWWELIFPNVRLCRLVPLHLFIDLTSLARPYTRTSPSSSLSYSIARSSAYGALCMRPQHFFYGSWYSPSPSRPSSREAYSICRTSNRLISRNAKPRSATILRKAKSGNKGSSSAVIVARRVNLPTLRDMITAPAPPELGTLQSRLEI